VSGEAALLEARGVQKSYPGVRALDGVDLAVHAGEVHGIIGENGAGKSTLVGILSGATRPDAGVLLRGGRPVHYASPAEAQADGVACVFQELELLPELSVTENLFAGRYLRRGLGLDWRGMARAARTALARVALDIAVQRPLGSYPLAVQQLVAITRALLLEARVVILDEPTSSLNPGEVETLFHDMIAGARHSIYIESQYLSNATIARRLASVMQRRPQLEAVIVTPRSYHGMLERGIYLPPSQFEAAFLSDAHGDGEIDRTLEAADESMEGLR